MEKICLKPSWNSSYEYHSTNAVTWTAVFCGQSPACFQAGFRKGWTLLFRCIFFFQVHNLPSCPVLKNFQQTVERRSVDSLLFLLEDGSRWLPVSMPPALGAALGLPRMEELYHLTVADTSPFWSAALSHQRLVPPHEVCASAMSMWGPVSWDRNINWGGEESTLRRPRCVLRSCFADSRGERGLQAVSERLCCHG